MNFSFVRNKNKFNWESDDIRLVFSKPSIQAHNDYVELKDEKGIMYYYYDVEIYKKIIVDWDDEREDDEDGGAIYKWKLVTKRSMYDFPSILDLKYIIDYIKKLDVKENGQKTILRNNDIIYSYRIDTTSFASEDLYEITKHERVAKDEESWVGEPIYYTFYMGCSFDCQGDNNSEGIRINYLTKESIDELYKCVEGFVKYSIEHHNENVKKHNKISAKNKVYSDGLLYQYYDYGDKKQLKKIEAFYIVSDYVQVTYIEDEKEIDIETQIKGLNERELITEKDVKIPLEKIVYITNRVENHKLVYNEEEVAKDFFEIMNSSLKKEFNENSIEYLLEKYDDAICDRTWMCREEHLFTHKLNPEEYMDNMKKIKPCIEVVIRLIKEML